MATTDNPLYRALAEIPRLAEWRRASSAARFQFMDRRGSPEIRAIDKCLDAYSNLALLPNTPTAQLWEAAVNLLEPGPDERLPGWEIPGAEGPLSSGRLLSKRRTGDTLQEGSGGVQ